MIRKALVAVLLITLFGCSSPATSETLGTNIIIKESKSTDEHFIQYTDSDKMFVKNVETGDVVRLYTLPGVIREALNLYIGGSSGHPIEGVDPESLDIGILRDIPCTYTSTLEMSTVYMDSLISSGWEVDSFYRCYDFADYYLTNGSACLRVVVFEDRLKVFRDIEAKFEEAHSYIIE